MNSVQNNLFSWLQQVLGASLAPLTPMVGDASARQYFRTQTQQARFVVMQASVNQAFDHFLGLQKILSTHKIRVPEIYHVEKNLGFVVMEDLGSQPLMSALKPMTVDTLHAKAMHCLVAMQNIAQDTLPVADAVFFFEQCEQLFWPWFLDAYLHLKLPQREQQALLSSLEYLCRGLEKQPKAFVHMDFHAENLMLLEEELAVLDFQDARYGPVAYDLVGLFEDRDSPWSREQIECWLYEFFQTKAFKDLKFKTWVKWYDWCALQRHIKNLGIFARLYKHAKKENYMAFIAPMLNRIICTALRYPETARMGVVFKDFIQPAFLLHQRKHRVA